MKAVATALVLIAGAAVVLWYGNTLNSWVLGGLIGGLAALLLSIPISLVLFSYLARHRGMYEERDAAEELDISIAHPAHHKNGRLESVYLYREVPPPGSIYVEEDDDAFPIEHGGWRDEEENARYLPAPSVRRLPAPALPPATSNTHSSDQRIPVTRRLSRDLSGRDVPRTTHRLTSRSLTGSQSGGLTRGQFQSQALHMARMEAVRQHQEDNEVEELPSYRSRRPMTHDQSSLERWEHEPNKSYPQRTRRIVDASPSPNSPYRASIDSEQSQRGKASHYQDPETDAIDVGLSTGSLKNPLLRRAPYLYDDDELKRQLERQIDAPITRRTSRKLSQSSDD